MDLTISSRNQPRMAFAGFSLHRPFPPLLFFSSLCKGKGCPLVASECSLWNSLEHVLMYFPKAMELISNAWDCITT